MSKVTVARMNLCFTERAEEAPDNAGWIMKRRKNDRKEKENNTNVAKPSKAVSEKKGAVVVDLTEKSENNNNSKQTQPEEDKNKPEKIKFTQILRDRIDGKFSDEDLRLLLVKVLSKPGHPKYHISDEVLNTPIPGAANNNNARAPESSNMRDNIPVDQGHEENSSSSSDDDYASDHSNNGDYGLLDSSPFALTQSFYQDTQQPQMYDDDDDLEIMSSQVKREPEPVESKPLPKMEINLPLEEDLIEVVESSDEEKMQIDTRAQIPDQKEEKSSLSEISPIKRSNTSVYSGSVDDWVTRKKPKTLSDYFSASSRSGSLSSLQGLDASSEMKKTDQSLDAVLESKTSSLKSSSSFSSKDKLLHIQIEVDDDDFKSPSSRSTSPVKHKSQSSGELKAKSSKSSKPKKSDKVTSSDQKSNAKKFKKQEASHRPTRRLDPEDDGHDLDDFK